MENPTSLTIIAAGLVLAQVFETTRPPVFTRFRPENSTARPVVNSSHLRRNCFAGCPILQRAYYDFGPTFLIARQAYALEVSGRDKVPLWVSEYVTASELDSHASGSLRYVADPLLPPQERSEPNDYRNAPFDLAPLASLAHQRTLKEVQADVFFMSNVAPQVPEFHRQVWKHLDFLTRRWIQARGAAYVITGGFFYDRREEDPAVATGAVRYLTIGPGRVAVPTHFYKIIIARNPRSHLFESIAFVLENRAYREPYDEQSYIRSIKWIEDRTGIRFMSQLEATDVARLKETEAQLWPTR